MRAQRVKSLPHVHRAEPYPRDLAQVGPHLKREKHLRRPAGLHRPLLVVTKLDSAQMEHEVLAI